MNISKTLIATLVGSALIFSTKAQASPVTISVSGAFANASGSLASLAGLSFVSNISYDTDISVAGDNVKTGSFAFCNSGTISCPDGETGQHLGVAYKNPTATFAITGSSLGFTSVDDLVAEISSNNPLTSAQTGGLIPAGIYDGFGFTEWMPGSTGPSGSTIGLGQSHYNAVNVDVGFLGNLNLFPTVTSTSSMPGSLDPANLIGVLVKMNKWENGALTGTAFQIGQLNGSFNSFTIVPAAIPVPAAVWLFGSGLIGLTGVARKRKAA